MSDTEIDLDLIAPRSFEDGRYVQTQQVIVYDSVTVQAWATAQLRFDGAGSPVGSPLSAEPEAYALARLLSQPAMRQWFAEALGFQATPTWWLLGATRERLGLSRHVPTSQPGEFDAIVGAYREDARLSFDTLAEVECKLVKVRERDGSPKTASGFGTAQAAGAVKLAFDRVLLAHLIVRDERALPEGYAASWISMTSAPTAEHIRRVASAVKKHESEGAREHCGFGYATLAWGHPPGRDPRYAGAVYPAMLRAPADRPWSNSRDSAASRGRLGTCLKQLLGENRPASPVFCFCVRCGELFGAVEPSDYCSATCGAPR